MGNRIMKYSDIQLTDEPTWASYKTAWEDSDFTSVLSTNLEKKKLYAELLNDLTAEIRGTQQNLKDGSMDLKAGKIKLLTSSNPILLNDEVYFQWTNP